MKSGIGQYTPDPFKRKDGKKLGPEDWFRDRARDWFLQAATELEPRVTSQLLQVYDEAVNLGCSFRNTDTRSRSRFATSPVDELRKACSYDPEIAVPLLSARERTEAWARTFNLTIVRATTEERVAPEWILRAAYSALSGWQSGYPRDQLMPPGVSMGYPYVDDIIDPPGRWNPFSGPTRETFQKDYLTYLSERLDRIEQDAIATGACKTVDVMKRLHCSWAAEFQVKGTNVRDLDLNKPNILSEDHDDYTIQNVGIQVNKVLNLIGLKRRISKLGRPRSS